MDIWITYAILPTMLFLIIFAFFYIIGMKWLHFGWRVWFAERRYGSNTGYLMIRSSGNNFPLPKIIDLKQYKKEIKDDTFVFSRNQLLGTTLFGKPFVMFDNDDNKTSLGLYFQESGERDEDGEIISAEPIYRKDASGNMLFDEHGEKIAKLTQLKPAISLPTSLFKSVVTQETFKNLKKYIKDVVSTYKWVFLIVVVIGIGIALILYFLYNQQETLPLVLESCKAAALSCGGAP